MESKGLRVNVSKTKVMMGGGPGEDRAGKWEIPLCYVPKWGREKLFTVQCMQEVGTQEV